MKKLYSKVDLWGIFVAGILFTSALVNYHEGKVGDAIFLLILMIPQLMMIFGDEIIGKIKSRKEVK